MRKHEPKNLVYIILFVAGLSLFAWYINVVFPNTFFSFVWFYAIIGITVFFLFHFLFSSVTRALLYTTGVLLFFFLRFFNLRGWYYMILLLVTILGIDFSVKKMK